MLLESMSEILKSDLYNYKSFIDDNRDNESTVIYSLEDEIRFHKKSIEFSEEGDNIVVSKKVIEILTPLVPYMNEKKELSATEVKAASEKFIPALKELFNLKEYN